MLDLKGFKIEKILPLDTLVTCSSFWTRLAGSQRPFYKMAKTTEEPINFVHQNAILCETINKETRNQKLYLNYSINPFKKSKLLGDIRVIPKL